MSDTPEQRLEDTLQTQLDMLIGSATCMQCNTHGRSIADTDKTEAAILAAVASSRVEWEAEMRKTLESLYNPSISDLELAEHQHGDMPEVVYLGQALDALQPPTKEAKG